MIRPRTLPIAGALAFTAVVIAAAATRRLEVVGASMRPTLEPGDRLLAVRVRPRRVVAGDLVVVPDPRHLRRLVVKRVVAVSATTVTVAGDNPETSTDSRTFGPVPLASVRGRVVYRYHPPDRRNPIGRLVP